MLARAVRAFSESPSWCGVHLRPSRLPFRFMAIRPCSANRCVPSVPGLVVPDVLAEADPHLLCQPWEVVRADSCGFLAALLEKLERQPRASAFRLPSGAARTGTQHLPRGRAGERAMKLTF